MFLTGEKICKLETKRLWNLNLLNNSKNHTKIFPYN